MKYILCSDCFIDEGLKLNSKKFGVLDNGICPNCGSNSGQKLDNEMLKSVVYAFFVRGTTFNENYGAAPVLKFSTRQTSDITVSAWVQNDLKLIEKNLGVGIFHYGPPLWMLGEVEPLLALQNDKLKAAIIARIISEYPHKELAENSHFYRIRKNLKSPESEEQYDSAPDSCLGQNRLDSIGLPILYASQNLELCIHECRVTMADHTYFATLQPTRPLKLLDLTHILQENVTEYESLDIAIHMLFSAPEHSYDICREIAIAANSNGYDGLIYPSYFSTLGTGSAPFPTLLGFSIRQFEELKDYARAQVIENIALFGRPLMDGIVTVKSINRVILNKVEYDLEFGPVEI